jgi:phosphate transport system substrate-binding protein
MHNDTLKNYIQLNMDEMLEQTAFYHRGYYSKPTNAYALGYTLYSFLKNREADSRRIEFEYLKILSFDGVAPSHNSIVDGSYPLSTIYYAVVRSDLPQEHNARSILKFLQSEDGKYYIQSADFLPLP